MWISSDYWLIRVNGKLFVTTSEWTSLPSGLVKSDRLPLPKEVRLNFPDYSIFGRIGWGIPKTTLVYVYWHATQLNNYPNITVIPCLPMGTPYSLQDINNLHL